MIVVIMGVSGSGKSTAGEMVAKRLGIPFLEADDYHSKENIDKMSHGLPLSDEDRYPWLLALSSLLQTAEKNKGAVLACSALKEKYRQLLQEGLQEKIKWVLLDGSEETLRKRMTKRSGHYMPEALLHSQLQTLEKPDYALCVSIEEDPNVIVNTIVHYLNKDA